MGEHTAHRAVAIVGVGAVLPDAPHAPAYWDNVKSGRCSIREVPPERWDPAIYYDPDPAAPDKSYSKIGAFALDWEWAPLSWRLPIPPKVGESMDLPQKWAIIATREALGDFGYPERSLDPERTAVIFGNAMAGDRHYLTALRILMPEFSEELIHAPSFASLPDHLRAAIGEELRAGVGQRLPAITEDTMPGELANIVAGRVAAMFDFHGPNYVVDAACASTMAAMTAAIEGLAEGHYDAVVTGGIDSNMGPPSYTKFCKIGALSATGANPYDHRADGFVMGEGTAVFLLKRLADAERDGDRVHAVIRGIGASSDGKGKGITAPNPLGQVLAMERAWKNAGISPLTATLIEGHGTSTRVGDAVEVQSLSEVFAKAGAPPAPIPLGSVKSNIGHLKGAAGAAAILKVALALRDKQIPPSLGYEKPNPGIDFSRAPFFVNTELRPWDQVAGAVRRAGVSAFGFGGTNFHVVMEEHVPGRLTSQGRTTVAMGSRGAGSPPPTALGSKAQAKAPLRGLVVLGAESDAELVKRLVSLRQEAEATTAPAPAFPLESDLRAPVRVAIDFEGAEELGAKCARALKAISSGQEAAWRALRAQGVFLGRGPAPKVAFLYPGQGSQYVNMLATLRTSEPIVADTFAEADRVMEPLLGKPLSSYVFVAPDDQARVERAEHDLMQTEITQPAVLAADLALTRMLAAYGIVPDLVMGHSLGEYAALVAAGAMPFADSLEAVSARGREMTKVSVADKGLMAAVLGPLEQIQSILAGIDGYVVVANINSSSQAVIGGATEAVEHALAAFAEAGLQAIVLPVSHAFHTAIVAPASEPLKQVLRRLRLAPPSIPVVANVSGDLYPMAPGSEAELVDILGKQIASPVQFIGGLRTLYREGVRVFVEVGPKKTLHGFVDDVLGHHGDVLALHTSHPKAGDRPSFNTALAGLYAAGFGVGRGLEGRAAAPAETAQAPVAAPVATSQGQASVLGAATARALGQAVVGAAELREGMGASPAGTLPASRYAELGRIFAEALERGFDVYAGGGGEERAVFVSGAGVGLPGTERVFADDNVERILRGDQLIDTVPLKLRRAMADKHVTRLVKSADGAPHFETIDSPAAVIKLAGRGGAFDLDTEFGFPAERLEALDQTTRLAIAAGLEALRDAGIPLVMRYKTTRTGSKLPDRWGLPESLRDETGVIFASAFPGLNAFAGELRGYHEDKARRERLAELESLRARFGNGAGQLGGQAAEELDHRIAALRAEIERQHYDFDSRFILKVLTMGHSQFAELIGARGPNTHVNAACASSTLALALASDWIRAGRCRRVIVISADDVTSDELFEWMGTGFLASGAAATDELVEDAALPFDRRRHGMVMGMGAAAFVVETREAAHERGLEPICELLATQMANSAYHGTRLDVAHIEGAMEELVSRAEARHGIDRRQIAAETVFLSHETYTPARGGSAQAEINALRHVFGADAERIVIANTKGLTGHAMGAGIEDAVCVKALETGLVPPVANFKEVDPELGALHLSQGGAYPIRYALRLAAGFGSQVCMSLLRWLPTPDGQRRPVDQLGYQYRIRSASRYKQWLAEASGQPAPVIEVSRRTLRIRDEGPPPEARRSVAGLRHLPGYPAPARPSTAAAVLTPDWDVSEPGRAPEPVAPRPTAVATASAPVPARPAAPPVASVDVVRERVLAIVAEKTGYPADMLELDQDLEADLGIDTVKQADTFAAVREAFAIPAEGEVKLRDFATLGAVIGFVYDRRPDLRPAAAAPIAGRPPAAPAAAADVVRERVLAIVAEKTGYPADMLELDQDLEADLGIDTVKQADTFAAVREAFAIPAEGEVKLRDFATLGAVIGFVYDRRPDLRPATAAVAAPLAAPAAVVVDVVRERVLAIVAEKTGYPADMLELDQDLEADLGIDTVKQADTFAAVREAFSIPADGEVKLRDFATLGAVIGFVYDRRPELRPGASTPEVTAEPPAPLPGASVSVASPPLLPSGDAAAAAAIPRRLPQAVLRPALDRCKRTAVSLTEKSRVVVMPDEGGVAASLEALLGALGVEVLRLDRQLGDDEIGARLEGWLAAGPIHGLYWLPALDPVDLTGLDLRGWRQALHLRVKRLFTVSRALHDSIEAPSTFLLSATRMGGRHGYEPAGASHPLGGAVSGFTKAFKRERDAALVKVVDFEPAFGPERIAERLVAETLGDPGAVEVGYQGDSRFTVTVREEPLAPRGPTVELGKDSVFVVTGAAGSIVSAIVGDLTLAAGGGTFHLLDLAAAPDRADPDLACFRRDREELKRRLIQRFEAEGERPTPVKIERQIAALERQSAALAAIETIERAGGQARYHSLNLLDEGAVAKVIDEVRRGHGRVDVLLHAAGIEISHMLPDKKPEEFDLVFDVKCDGWFNLLRALGDMPLGATVVFSSVAGRFGNAGQTDYASANDLLCKLTSNLRTVRPDTCAVAIDWSAWSGIGMAARGSIPRMMRIAGIDMLAPSAGIPIVRREITGAGSGEVVIGQRLGLLLEEWDESGGLDLAALSEERGPMLAEVLGMTVHGGLVVETELDPRQQPFLHDHQIEGTPVLPGVMGIEAFGELARLLFPERQVVAFEHIRFLSPFKFYRSEPRRVILAAQFRPEGEDLVAECRLIGRRQLPTQPEPLETVHFTAEVRLGLEAAPSSQVAPPRAPTGRSADREAIYRVFFHGAAYQVLEEVWAHDGSVVGRMPAELPANHQPAHLPTVIDPRWVELCLQTAGVWEIGTKGQLALPAGIDRLTAVEARLPRGAVHARVTAGAGDSFDAIVADESGAVLVCVEGYRTAALPSGIEDERRRPLASVLASPAEGSA